MAIVSKDDDTAEDLTWVRFGSAPLIVTLVLPLVIGVILLLKCILNHCCVRKSTAKDEMYGVEGRMTILVNSETSFVPTTTTATNSVSPPPSSSTIPSSQQQQVKSARHNSSDRSSGESNRSSLKESKVNNNNSNSSSNNGNSSPVPSSSSTAGAAATTTVLVTSAESTLQQPISNESYEIVDLSSDNVKSSTLHRQLPDLPNQPPNHHLLEGPNPPRRSSSLLSHDGTSELYATVGEVPNPDDLPSHSSKSSGAYNAKKFKEKGGGSSKGPQPGTSKGTKGEPSSDSETYGNSAIHHPYAKLKRKDVAEHPYARVRSGSTGTGGDEETDTDNYDTPQPYAQTGGAGVAARLAQAGSSSSSRSGHHHHRQSGSRDVVDGSANAGSANAEAASGNPVPPRRMGRGWRRGSHPPAQAYDNPAQQQHFSGDSQDSRGYTSISVREPLSNIVPNRRPPGQRNYDSHYATVSDDSEEMYAAIEDAEGNYMRIPGEDGDPPRHWHGPNIASPIPERREANSPLPPPPVPPLASPPELSPTGPVAAPDTNPAISPTPVAASTPPLYAQVTKKTKKPKAPVTPTSSAGPSVSSSSQPLLDKKPVSATSSLPVAASPQLSTSSSIHSSSVAAVKTRSDKAAALLSPTNESSEPRRWSKADISYSEFEVVREPMYSSSARKLNSSSASSSIASQQKPQQSSSARKPIPAEVVDEDNYNVIPEDRGLPRSSRAGNSSSNNVPPPPRIHHPIHQNNYQEIGELEISNPYQEIQPKESSSDYYQEIGTGDSNDRNGLDSNNLYQEIDKKVPSSSTGGRHENAIAIDDEDDPADQFYETVKPAAAALAKQAAAAKTQHLPSPSHSQGSVTSLDRKHGYEKLKKKAGSPTIVVIASDDDDDEDDDTKNEDSLYERVKYPPYERLKESRDDLRTSDHDDLPLDSQTETDRFYEDIGYSRVKPKKSQGRVEKAEEQQPSTSSKTVVMENDEEPNNLDQLYARVDKTKKKKHNNTNSQPVTITTTTATTAISAVTTTTASHLHHHHQQQQHPPPPRLEIRREEITQTCIVLRTDNDGDDDESIEYI